LIPDQTSISPNMVGEPPTISPTIVNMIGALAIIHSPRVASLNGSGKYV
jgi:hypothetical protein